MKNDIIKTLSSMNEGTIGSYELQGLFDQSFSGDQRLEALVNIVNYLSGLFPADDGSGQYCGPIGFEVVQLILNELETNPDGVVGKPVERGRAFQSFLRGLFLPRVKPVELAALLKVIISGNSVPSELYEKLVDRRGINTFVDVGTKTVYLCGIAFPADEQGKYCNDNGKKVLNLIFNQLLLFEQLPNNP